METIKIQVSYIDLNPQQRKRCVQLMNYISDEQTAVQLTQMISSHGMNSFKEIIYKLQTLHTATGTEKQYYDSLGARFELNRIYTVGEIVAAVLETRRQISIQPFVSDIERQCITDFAKCFVTEAQEPEGPQRLNKNGKPIKSKLKASYIPKIKLKP